MNQFIPCIQSSLPIVLAVIGLLSALSAAFAAVPTIFPKAGPGWTTASKWCGTFAVDLGRVVRVLQGFASGNSSAKGTTITLGSLLIPLVFLGCSGTFGEARLARHPKAATATGDVKLTLSERCQTLSDRGRWEGALAKGGAALTGASGLATIPFDGKGERIAIAGTTVLLAAGTVLVTFLQESDAAAFIKECAQ